MLAHKNDIITPSHPLIIWLIFAPWALSGRFQASIAQLRALGRPVSVLGAHKAEGLQCHNCNNM